MDGLDLSVGVGEVFGFLGPTARGRRSACACCSGLSGAVRFGLAPWQAYRIGGLASVGAVVEEPPFYPWLSGRDNLRVLAGVGAPVAVAALEDAMERCGNASAAGRKVRTTRRACAAWTIGLRSWWPARPSMGVGHGLALALTDVVRSLLELAVFAALGTLAAVVTGSRLGDAARWDVRSWGFPGAQQHRPHPGASVLLADGLDAGSTIPPSGRRTGCGTTGSHPASPYPSLLVEWRGWWGSSVFAAVLSGVIFSART